MHQHDQQVVPPSTPPRSRWRRPLSLGGLLLFLALCLGGPYLYFAVVSSQRLQEAIEEANRLDPHWQLLDIEAHRTIISDKDNSAINLMKAGSLMPTNSPYRELHDTPENEKRLREEMNALEEWKVEAPRQLDDVQIVALRTELKRAASALAEAYKILDKPRGRYPIAYSKGFLNILTPPYAAETRELAGLLAHDALLRTQDKDLNGAIMSCRCLIHAQRAIGDEPSLISMMVRSAIHRLALGSLERILAQGEPPESTLAVIQQLLEEEAAEPLFLIGARGQRGMEDGCLSAIQNGDLPLSDVRSLARAAAGPKGDPYALYELRLSLVPGAVRADRAALLRFNNELVEIAKRPVEEQKALLQKLDARVKDLPKISGILTPAWPKVFDTFQRDATDLRCSVVMVAVERYRRAQGRWPKQLTDLVPRYLSKVPVDPYDGVALRFRQTKETVVVYSVGADGEDNGGNLDDDPRKPGTDRGFRLWDVAKRRQPARPRNK